MGKEEIASKLKKARVNSKMTQKEVADILGMTYQAISNYERGKTKVESDILVKLCKIYNVSVPDILSDNTKINTPPNSSKKAKNFELSETEKQIIIAYRKADEIGKAVVLRSLGIDEENISKKKTKPKVG